MAKPFSIDAQGWGWQHAGRRSWAVRGLDFHIEPGERVLLLGPTGAGKSTVIRGLAGVLGGDDDGTAQGQLLVDGQRAGVPGKAGLVLQDPDAQVILEKVGDDVAFGCENLCVPREEIWRRVHDSLDAVGLRVGLDRRTAALSGGQRQRLALAGVLAMQPGLLLLDEPTANLDPAGVLDVRDAVLNAVADRSMTLVVIEHHVDIWADVVDRVIVLEPGGGVLVEGPPATVFTTHREQLAQAGVWVPGLPEVSALPESSAKQEIISATDLVVGYDQPVRQFEQIGLVQGISTTLTGPNGVGKSTLALTLAGLLPPLSGSVQASAALAAGLRTAHPVKWRSKELLTRIGVVFQNPEHQFVTGTVRDELALGLRALKRSPQEINTAVEQVLERLRLTALAEANPFTLSGGEKRRLSVATVLVAQPQVIILDEPTFGQDRVTWVELVRLIAQVVADGSTVLSSTHDLPYVAALGQQRIELA
ncbi:MAG: ABC transporter ATP-binding protein [Propionibacteriaceae bacterium]